MHTLTFSDSKRVILAFAADALSFERQEGGILLSAEGEMTQQDNAALEDLTASGRSCAVRIEKQEETLLNAQLTPTFFTLEKAAVIALLA